MQRLVNNIFLYKREMMGLAILGLMLFHSSGFSLFGVKNMLECGVDIFLFLSGFTCAHSYVKSYKKLGYFRGYWLFYKKRYWKVLPPFLILYSLFYGRIYLIHGGWNWIGFLGKITMYDNWMHNDISMWYVAALLFMYLLIPPYVDLCKKHRIALLIPIIFIVSLCCLMLSNFWSYIPFRMAWVRFPIFLLGVNLYILRDFRLKINKLALFGFGILSFIITILPPVS